MTTSHQPGSAMARALTEVATERDVAGALERLPGGPALPPA
ncbi:hypothetical protein [Streptomyces griseoluteus]